MSIKLTYFDIPGRSEPLRLIFQAGGVEFQDERISMEEFAKIKESGVFKYNQLPVLEVNGQQFAQSGAIARFAASKGGLLPSDPIDLMRAEQLSNNIDEINLKLVPTFYQQGDDKKKSREELATNVYPKWLAFIEKDLEQNGGNGFVAGNKLSFADIILYNFAYYLQSGEILYIPKDIISKYPNITKVYQNVASNPKIQEWYTKYPRVFQQN